MDTSLTLPAVLCFLGVAQALLLALALLTIRRGNLTANRILAAFAVSVSVSMGATILSNLHYFQIYPHLSRISHPFDFLGGPLLFLYIRALTKRGFVFTKKTLLHFVPAALVVIYLTPFYLQSWEYKHSALPTTSWYYARSALVISQFLIYLVLIIVMLVRYSRRVKTQATTAEKAILFQVRFVVVSFLGLWVLGLIRYALDLRYPEPHHLRQTNWILPLAVTGIFYALAYFGLKKPEVLSGPEQVPREKKYERSTLTPERSQRYLRRLQDAMEIEKVYTDGTLTLQKLAAKLSIPAQHLSQVVNEQLNQNILDYLNTQRVEEAKRRLLDPARKHLSILAIAEEVGFNSKSSFNSVFKKHTNITPSEFRKGAANGNHQNKPASMTRAPRP
jgi:AraC-like DNA-binding protein